MTPPTDPAKKILHIDMDNTLVDFRSGLARVPQPILDEYGDDPDDIPGIFSLMDPMPHAIESYERLNEIFEVYILSTAPWNNPSAWSDKLLWVKRYLGHVNEKRLTLSHNKHLAIGDFLVDDRDKHGAEHFRGEWIRIGTDEFPTWKEVVPYLEARA